MSKQFIQWTSGWIPVSVMLLFATALVLGQDRPAPSQAAVPLTVAVDVEAARDAAEVGRLEPVHIVPDPAAAATPIDATRHINPDAGHDDRASMQ